MTSMACPRSCGFLFTRVTTLCCSPVSHCTSSISYSPTSSPEFDPVDVVKCKLKASLKSKSAYPSTPSTRELDIGAKTTMTCPSRGPCPHLTKVGYAILDCMLVCPLVHSALSLIIVVCRGSILPYCVRAPRPQVSARRLLRLISGTRRGQGRL